MISLDFFSASHTTLIKYPGDEVTSSSQSIFLMKALMQPFGNSQIYYPYISPLLKLYIQPDLILKHNFNQFTSQCLQTGLLESGPRMEIGMFVVPRASPLMRNFQVGKK